MMKRVVILLALSLFSGFVSSLAWSNGIAITNARIFTGATPESPPAPKPKTSPSEAPVHPVRPQGR